MESCSVCLVNLNLQAFRGLAQIDQWARMSDSSVCVPVRFVACYRTARKLLGSAYGL